jgi:hypothetical protein
MEPIFKLVGVFSIVALSAFPAGSLAQENLSDATFCKRAIKSDRSGWVEGSFAEEAERRGLTFRACNEMNNPPAQAQPEPPAATNQEPPSRDSGDSNRRSLLEAVAFFMTGVDAGADEIVSDNQIVLRNYPIVVYLVDGNRCVARLRLMTTHAIWQLDFCKITEYRWERQGFWEWYGDPGVFCQAKWLPDENYIEPDFTRIGTVKCKGNTAFQGNWDAELFVTGKFDLTRGWRSQDRVMAAYKYIVTLLTGKPY